jgi:hypothetical protein
MQPFADSIPGKQVTGTLISSEAHDPCSLRITEPFAEGRSQRGLVRGRD